MDDILDAAQSNTQPPSGTTPPVPPVVEPVPEVPMEPVPVPPTPPVISFEPATTSEPIAPSSDSLIVPPPETPAPEPTISSAPPVPPPTEKPKKKSGIGVLLAGLLLLVITLPILVFYVRQQIEIRSRAMTDVYPPGTCPTNLEECNTAGEECVTGKGSHYCCVNNPSGTRTWAPNTWGTCPTNPTCPWGTATPCCPNSVDACDYTAGQTICINDPFTSNCTKWGDGTCPGGGGFWQASHWYKDCTTEGCGGNANLVCVDNAGGTGINLCRNKNCLDKKDCVCAGTTVTPTTPTPRPGTTNTPTPTPTPGSPGQCVRIKAYMGTTLLTADDLSNLQPGDTITFALVPSGQATKAHFRINSSSNSDWHETTLKNSQSEFIWNWTVPPNVISFTIEGESFDGSAWH